jgi:putative endonuclease
MSASRRAALAKGILAECRVANALEEQGWRILARNWRGGRGELDVVAVKAGHLRFVEVKARPTVDQGLDAVTPAKRRCLVSAGRAWLSQYGDPKQDVSFVLAIVLGAEAAGRIEWVSDPFDENG